ncbi:1-aminocyclopropane-1-carboxylate deaminase/D-cysteine desulfhydrase [Ilumatobacter coccineus]|uniref:Putative D-cysteine desulfhydrase n=1 Tax=Ilumatobacter coccineus (strain NBRC 103263 / KCTC 29153 / YM16-304) TaxID=1313172 RepID=A0A6C7EC52_ILUCY|nr:pyridoxal-phosphate dependent enzyme [Ilumatobacter coccineus]BAN03960.1 putative D-cysteine desulfhydrase [Ilumatobacter coccineus YM16-304]
MFDDLPRAPLATLPTPLETAAPMPNSAARLWVKRDDLTGLGGGGNKARKLEFLCGDALEAGARSLITVGAAQSNHCRMTAAAGARLGLEVHLILSGDAPEPPGTETGNQLLSKMFGAQMHYTGAAESHWGQLEIAREALTDQLAGEGLAPYSIPIGGSTAVGGLGYAAAFVELIDQCEAADRMPSAIVFTSSSGGTHAGLLAGRAALIASGRLTADTAPDVVAIGVAKGVVMGLPDIAELADGVLDLMGVAARVDPNDIEVDGRWIGDDYAVPTAAGDAAVEWAAMANGLLVDRTYSGKGLSGLLGLAAEGRWSADDDVVFIHTGGWPALFA